MTIAQRVTLTLLQLYQRSVSPDHGPLRTAGACRYYPSCSQYAIDAVRAHGAWRGLAQAGWRVLRCNPWSHGGVDYAK